LSPESQRKVLNYAEFLSQKHLSPLEQILSDVRQRAATVPPEELETLIEEARQGFYDSSVL
jgi:hypothetical protein